MSNTPLPPIYKNHAGKWIDVDDCVAHAAAVTAAKDERIKALEDLLWVLAEHNELHFGKSHSTVIQCRAALRAERDAAFAMSRCECATDEACAELAKLRQYLDTAQRRASALGDEVAGLREALHSIAWSRPPGRTSKMVEALEKKALAALAARKGAA